MSLITSADSYKISHAKLYPKNLQYLYAYLESRGGPYDAVVFGLEPFIDNLTKATFDPRSIDYAEELCAQHFGSRDVFPRDKWERLWNKYHGALPLRIRFAKEGSVIPAHNVLLTVENTDPEFPWLVTFIETILLNSLWYPMTIAGQSRHIYNSIAPLFEQSVDGDWETSARFAVHDFGYRGVATEEQGDIGGAAHLLSFNGTDTLGALAFAASRYGVDTVAGFSVPALEHSVVQTFATEEQAYRNAMDVFPTGPLSVVSDTYDYFNALDNVWGGSLHDKVMERDGTIVIRPDSGDDPAQVIVESLQSAARNFGCYRNNKGFYDLPKQIRFIYGDGMTSTTIPALFQAVVNTGFAASNVVTGSGGGLLQKVNRDTLRFGYKVSEATYQGGISVAVHKEPKDDPTKRSKSGRLSLIKDGLGDYRTVSQAETPYELDFLSEDIYLLDDTYYPPTFDQIRQRVRS